MQPLRSPSVQSSAIQPYHQRTYPYSSKLISEGGVLKKDQIIKDFKKLYFNGENGSNFIQYVTVLQAKLNQASLVPDGADISNLTDLFEKMGVSVDKKENFIKDIILAATHNPSHKMPFTNLDTRPNWFGFVNKTNTISTIITNVENQLKFNPQLVGAVTQGRPSLVIEYLKKGAHPDTCVYPGLPNATPLVVMAAENMMKCTGRGIEFEIFKNHVLIFTQLILAGANVNAADSKSSNTALHKIVDQNLALISSKALAEIKGIIMLLKSNGASLNLVNKAGQTVRAVAIENNNKEILDEIFSASHLSG